jgi:hypothetical protein
MRFEKGNSFSANGNGSGRPKGSKNRLAARVYEDVFRLWNEPAAEGSELSRGEAALVTLAREKPSEFVKVVFSILPRDLVIENVAAALDDDESAHMISMLRERVLAARQEQAQLAEVKTITDGRAN